MAIAGVSTGALPADDKDKSAFPSPPQAAFFGRFVAAARGAMLDKKSDAEQRPVPSDAPPRHATWPTASQLIIADVIGIGVMAMAEAFAELGWVLGVGVCLLMLPLNQLSGIMVWATIVEVHPDALSLADLARRCLGRAAYWATYALVYSFIFMTLGDYLLSLGLCLQILFPEAALPSYAWTCLAAAMLLPFCQVRAPKQRHDPLPL